LLDSSNDNGDDRFDGIKITDIIKSMSESSNIPSSSMLTPLKSVTEEILTPRNYNESNRQTTPIGQIRSEEEINLNKLSDAEILCPLIILIVVITAEIFYRKPLDKWTHNIQAKYQKDYMETNIITVWFYQYIHMCSGGNELCFLFFYHLAISGKYHRAYITAISISFNFVLVNSLIVWYQQPRPYWVD